MKTTKPVARIRSFAIAAICAAMIAGCMGHTPQRAAGNYVDSLKLYNYPACYQALTHQDQVDRTLDQFLSEIPLAPDVSKDWFKTILHAVDFEVGDAKIDGDKADVVIHVTRPDLPLWERTIDATLGPNDTPDSVAQKQVNDKTYPKLTYDDNVALVQQGGEWKIFVDFPAKENIEKIHKDAIAAYHQHDYDKAITLYQQAIAELDKEQATGNAGMKFTYNRELADVQNAKNQIPDAQAYIPKIVLSDVDMKMSASRVPAIFGKMTNSGDKAIDEVQFTVTYWEGKGKKKAQVFTEVHVPVATPLEFTDFARPVLPFVPGETRTFGFKLTAPPDVQQKATPDLNVTSIVFTQSSAPLPKPPTPTPTESPTPAAGASPAAGAAPSQASLPPPPPQKK
ncbi:MAG TPA: tetratricopeptide repeat protein [Candidatus Binataceae bacterium]|nr:tetratricopeptide repeat protein [Candidatus Binataceae bacterium]